MKNLRDYLFEFESDSMNVKTKDVINTLKPVENPGQIKKDINVNKPKVTYIDVVELFIKKCNDWFDNYSKKIDKILSEEGKGFLGKNLGNEWVEYYADAYMGLFKSLYALEQYFKENINKDINKDINEGGISVNNVKNYEDIYDLFVSLNKLDDILLNCEKKNNVKNKYKDLLELRLNVSENIKKLFKSSEKLKIFIETVYKCKNMSIR
jgi:hypothetical protein